MDGLPAQHTGGDLKYFTMAAFSRWREDKQKLT